MGYFFRFGGEVLEVSFARWGRVVVHHGGRDVARGRTLFGRPFRTSFKVREGGASVSYDLEIRAFGALSGPRIEIRRDGEPVAGWR